MKTLDAADVTVVILAYNNAHDTQTCLESLAALTAQPGNIFVVDNGSRNDSAERLREYILRSSLRVSLIVLEENTGYAAGNNTGIRSALENPSCHAVWILNNDTETAPEALDLLCRRLNSRPDAGMAGSTLVYAHDRGVVQCAGGFAFTKYWGTTPAVGGKLPLRTVLQRAPIDVERELGYLCGASMLIRRDVFDRIGYFSEDFFLYYEDAEFCLRARRAGYAIAWAPGSIVYHKEGASTGAESSVGGRPFRRPEFVDYLSLRNRISVVRMYYPYFLPLALLGYAGVVINRIRRGQGERIPIVFKAVRDGLTGRMGKPGMRV